MSTLTIFSNLRFIGFSMSREWEGSDSIFNDESVLASNTILLLSQYHWLHILEQTLSPFFHRISSKLLNENI